MVWYDEVNAYDFDKGTSVSGTNHFTQLIWPNSSAIGFGLTKADDSLYNGVANYYPGGNVQANLFKMLNEDYYLLMELYEYYLYSCNYSAFENLALNV